MKPWLLLLTFPFGCLATYANSSDFCTTQEVQLSTKLDIMYKMAWSDDIFERREKANADFKDNLSQALTDPRSNTCDWSGLSGLVHIRYSPDKRLSAFTWDATGSGTMHVFDGVFRFVDDAGNPQVLSDDSGGENFRIEQMNINPQKGWSPVYLVVGYGIGSSSIHGQRLNLLQFQNNRLTPVKLIRTKQGDADSIVFTYSPFSMSETDNLNELISIDSQQNSFSIPVIIENMEFPGGQITKRRLNYRYNGKVFVYTGTTNRQ